MQYDLRRAGYVVDPPVDDDLTRVESDDPELNGGVMLDPEHKH